MESEKIHIKDLLTERDKYLLIDVRSEAEYMQGHVRGAINIPVLNNEERVIVGTLYKTEGKNAAVLKGFEMVGPRFHLLMKLATKISADKPIIVYCWRGGMRSEIFTWLLQMAGLKVQRIFGGYKQYRHFTYQKVRKDYRLIVLGGKTGSGKTRLINQMKSAGMQAIDLEGLASHKGSVFGGIGMSPQPSNEQFENLLAEELLLFDEEKPIWVENESHMIGKVVLPNEFAAQIKTAPLVDIIVRDEGRVERIREEYANLPKEALIEATKKLEKRLGNQRMQQTIAAIESGDQDTWINILIQYYDKSYIHNLGKTDTSRVITLDLTQINSNDSVSLLKLAGKQIAMQWNEND